MNPLHELELPPYLDGETPTWHDRKSWATRCYTPDGEPLPSDLDSYARTWERIHAYKLDRENFRRTEFMVEGSGEMAVSTVYLGLDHQHGDSGPILIWETMIFGGPFDEYQWRYATRAAAMAGHQKICAALAALFGNPPQVEVDLPGMYLRQGEQ